MYKFAFYFFYKIFLKLYDDTIFMSRLCVGILVCLHLISAAQILMYFRIIKGLPVFSDDYLFNKLAWSPFVFLVFYFVFLYLNKEKTGSIFEKQTTIIIR
jgi:hypothetical protein